MLTIGSLATGYGGLDLAVERLTGAKTVWVSEVDPGACTILEHRFPGIPNLGDFTRAYWARVPHVDILTAGYPCQPFSHAGRRKGTDDERHLWPYIATAILALRPRLVVLENVAGHLSLGFGDVLGDLASLGYDAEWVSLRAADVGACHGRRRVFVAAYPRGERGLERWLAAPVEASSGRPLGELAGRGRALPTPTVRDVKGHNQRRDDTCLTGALLPTPRASDGEKGGPNQRGSSGDLMLPSALALLPTPSAADGLGGHEARGGAPKDQPHRWGDYAAAITRHEHLYGPAPDPTEPTGKGGAHRLSPRFAEWLMCLPAGWVTDPAIWHGWTPSKARTAQLKALGNGVVPPQALAALQHMAARHGALAA